MEDLELSLNYKKIETILSTNKEINNKIKQKDASNNQRVINEILQLLDNEFINFIKTFEEKNIENKLNDNQKYELLKNEYPLNKKEKLYYYDNCQIINQEIYDCLKKINKNKLSEKKVVECYLYGDKILAPINLTINFGKIGENNIFIVENIINSKSKQDLQNIIEYTQNHEYSNFVKFIKGKLIQINNPKIPSQKIEVKIFNILEEPISEKLKTIITLLLINENKKITNKNFEKYFLINIKWKDKYNDEINKIYSLIKNEIEKVKSNNTPLNSNQLNDIIFQLNNQSFMEIDEKVKNEDIDFSSEIAWENVDLIGKTIKICKNFIIINQEIFNFIKNEIGYSINAKNINYLSIKNGDIITIETDKQNSMLIGNIEENNFKIKYILEFNSNKILNDEKKNINDIDKYIEKRMVFNKDNKNDLISPILEKNTLIGYCYQYKSDISVNYNNLTNFYQFLSNVKINKSMIIYYNYKHLEQLLNNQNKSKQGNKYYLINKKLITEIKVNIEFKIIYEYMENNNIQEEDNNRDKEIISIIKSLSDDALNLYKNEKIEECDMNNIELNIISVKYIQNKENSVFIYNNFEIFRKDLFEKFINEKSIKSFKLLECTFNDGKIIINYPDNLNEKKYVSVIGTINNEKTFKIEYLLIYYDNNEKNNHLNKIKNGLNNYLKNVQFVNETAPIINNSFKEIGIIVQYNSNNDEININNDINGIYNNFNSINVNNNQDYEYNLDEEVSNPSLSNNFNCCPKIGLENIGATCYMNATLQCFCHIGKFIEFFKYNPQVKKITKEDKNTLTSSFKLLIEKLWPSKNRISSQNYYAPEEFKKKISKMNPLFEGIAANDAKDLVNFIIMRLHEELNKVKNNDTNYSTILDQRNQQLMFNTFVNDFIQTNKSIISDLFYGINCNITQCNGCNAQIFNYQTYFFIVFPLEEIRKYKFNNYNNQINICNQLNYKNQLNNFTYQFNNYNINEVSIMDCFDYDKKISVMSGDNAMYCNYCRNTCNCSMCTTLTTGPQILILLLNRGKGIEFKVKINFTEQLVLNNSYIQMNNNIPAIYKLIGVITHIGDSSMSGHFIAYCRDPITDQWHKYNDAMVTDVINFQNEVINFAMPYLLFYQKIQ